VRDVRGFATKFYTRTGNFDLVGNNMPVFFIQDGIKFPDIVHAVKPEPHHEMPQASSAHDTFWDFISLVPETAHMVMWLMSDRAIPRSFRMMEGFGVHTFKLVNARGEVRLCKFHWKPLLGAHSLVWDEAQKLAGKDPDFHRRDLWEAIECGHFPEYELGLQVIDEKDEQAFGFDLLDATKLLPEELVPVQRIGKMTLDRNPDNFFAETEQIAFCVQNLVPGIDVTNDPLMQARLFSYLDTQLTRLGGPNFTQLPINRPVAPVHNHQQDGFHQYGVPTMRANYHPNSIDIGCPFLARATTGFVHAPEPVEGEKTRRRSESFADHFSQARLFLASQSPAERLHLVNAFRFEVGKVQRHAIRERVLAMFANVDPQLAYEIGEGLGLARFVNTLPMDNRHGHEAHGTPDRSPALSLDSQPKDSIKSRKVAIVTADGAPVDEIMMLKAELAKAGATAEVIAPHAGSLVLSDGSLVAIDHTLLIAHPVMYDAICLIADTAGAVALRRSSNAVDFVLDGFRHAKTLGAIGEAASLVEQLLGDMRKSPGVVLAPRASELVEPFINAMKAHRHFERELVAAR
ncbi:MAG: catalase, partial [bacterium]